VVLSTLMKIPSACGCNNGGHVVVMKRIVIGNNTVFTTAYGSPTPGIITAAGDVPTYTSDATARADGFANLMTLNDNEIAFLAESYFTAPDLAVPGVFNGLASYQNAIF
jgi:hypothetical protein